MYLDEKDGTRVIVCAVGKTTLLYDARAIDDLKAMLAARSDWVELGSADEQKPAKEGTVEAWARSADNPIGGWYGLKKGLRGRFGMYMPPLLETPRAGRGRAQPAEQPDARSLGVRERAQPDRRQSRIGRRLRMEQMGELAHAGCESRRRAGVVSVAVDRDHRARKVEVGGAPAASSTPKPHGPAITSSGSSDSTSSQVVDLEGWPCRPSTSSPPASSIISGSQCPAQNGGSIHSAKNTRRRGRPRTEAAARAIVVQHLVRELVATRRDTESAPQHSHRLGNLAQRARVEREHLRADRAGRRKLAARDRAHRKGPA